VKKGQTKRVPNGPINAAGPPPLYPPLPTVPIQTKRRFDDPETRNLPTTHPKLLPPTGNWWLQGGKWRIYQRAYPPAPTKQENCLKSGYQPQNMFPWFFSNSLFKGHIKHIKGHGFQSEMALQVPHQKVGRSSKAFPLTVTKRSIATPHFMAWR